MSRRLRGITWLFGLIFLVLWHPAFAKETAPASLREAKSQLTEQKSKIQSLKEMIFHALKIHTKNEHELKATELKVSSLQQTFNRTNQQATQQEKELAALEAHIAELEKRQQAQQTAFGKNVRSAYRNSQHSRLQLMLNQEDPEAVSRMLKYYEYITRSQLSSLQNYQQTLEKLRQLNQEKADKLQQLQHKKVELSSTRLQLNESLQERKTVLQESRAKIAREKSQLRELQKDQQALTNLITRLNRQQKKPPPQPSHTKSNSRKPQAPVRVQPLRGDLLWPTQGQLAHRFGESRAEGQLRWNGIFISASSGTPVVAVRGGTVVFAEWLRGFGLLLIIDHNNGYLSLYGHNANLLKKVGVTVNTGETIAHVGQTGGNDQSGLYFEIRAQGRPVDPLTWMPKR